MKKNRFLLFVIALAGLIVMSQSAPIARAQDQPPDQAQVQDQNQDQSQDQAPAQDPPGRVARLDYSTGAVSFQPGGEGDWVTAVNNRPLTTGDNLWADKNSRAELQIGSTSIRMDSETSLTFLDLDDHTTQLKLSQGTLIVRVRHLDDGDTFEVDTPNLAFAIQSIGEYRVDVNGDGDQTIATVWRGRGEATRRRFVLRCDRRAASHVQRNRSTRPRDCAGPRFRRFRYTLPSTATGAKTRPTPPIISPLR